MKKKLLIVAIIFTLLNVSVMAKGDANLFIDGKKQEADVILKDNRTFVPLRFISENLGYKVQYDNGAKKITISRDGDVLEMKVNSKDFKVNGSKKQMDVATFLNKDRTYVPIRFISEAFGKEVGWDQNSKTAYIGKKPEKLPQQVKSSYVVKEFPEYGYKLFIPAGYENKIIFKPSTTRNGIELYSKVVEDYQKGAGYLCGYYLERRNYKYDEFLEAPVWLSEKSMIMKSSSTDFIASEGKLYDEMMSCFKITDSTFLLPMTNKFPDVKDLSVKFDNNKFIYTFGSPKLQVTMDAKYLKDIQLRLDYDSIAFYDISNLGYGGFLFSIYQADKQNNEKPLITLNEQKSVQLDMPYDVQFGPNGKKYNESMKVLVNEVKIKTVNNGENTINGFTGNAYKY